MEGLPYSTVDPLTSKLTIALFVFGFGLPILFIVLLASLVFKNADSQIFSNENGGTVQSDNYVEDDKVLNY